jgi:hydroxylysine kinase
MEAALRDLVEPFGRMGAAEVSALLASEYGVAAVSLTLLDTERDDSYRVITVDGEFVLKVAHPADDPTVIDLQVAAVVHASAAGLPVPTVLPAVSGALSTRWNGRSARLYSWLDGSLLRSVSPTAAHLFSCGAMLGALSAALADFEHPAADRVIAWDLAHLDVLAPLAVDPLTGGVLARFARDVAPELAGLPRQVIHNDFHTGNVLVEVAAPSFVVGILDFGDTVHTARVCDLGVSLAYLLPAHGPMWPAVQPFIDGYESVVPLLPEERELLPDLVAARLVQRILINTALDPEDDSAPNRALLAGLLAQN